MDLLTLASRHRTWLAARQATVAENIANANTPGFRTRAVQPFDEALGAQQSAATTTTHARHLQPQDVGRATVVELSDEAGASNHSGNSVSIEDQMLTAGSVKREYALNASISRTFRRMVMAGLRG